MKHIGTILGSAIAGIFVMSVWGAFVGEHGIGGGWFAGLIIIGSMWYMNHFLGLIDNPGAFIDMALGIGVAGFVRPMFSDGFQVGIDSLPTLAIVLVGGACGGVAAVMLEKHWAKNVVEVEDVNKAA
ncbi:hypothetical protein HYG86_07460 [Alkalicella caledoniensis]|uniref:Uncharacterized protein n=1 Tax=Alkalicella caledoniensis TaxID=2731377 RepID=A0A7G9W7H0_ALKCA|nr:hypothetical protein [Alkalicella caledoniensis]QNO14632.1 hypothetical protein HYG86_07460 [Alkalicella caledoniensis]